MNAARTGSRLSQAPARRRRRIPLLLVPLLLAAASTAGARQPATLSLDDAIALALRNNPDFLSQRNREAESAWAVREARWALLPTVSAGVGAQYQAAGPLSLGVLSGSDLGVGSATSYYLSNYNIGISYRLNGGTLARIAQEEASQDAANAMVDASAAALRADVTRQYLAVLRARDGVALARRELERSRDNVRLAEARAAVGSGIALEVRQAEVERGRAEVALLQAENLQQTETVRLMQRLGVEFEDDIELTTVFDVFEPTWSREQLIEFAVAAHPQVRALRAQRRAAEAAVTAARSTYLPTLDFTAGWSGRTRQAGNPDYLVDQARRQFVSQRNQCELINAISVRLTEPLPGTPANCGAFDLSPEDEDRIRAENRAFPFNFRSEPWSASLRLSIPIFTGYSRPRQVEMARVQVDDAQHRLRAEELRLKADVTTAHLNLITAERSFRIEERNRELAEEQHRMARERFAAGIASFIELADAETVLARADRAYLAAAYTFHEALAALEAAVGAPLRGGAAVQAP